MPLWQMQSWGSFTTSDPRFSSAIVTKPHSTHALPVRGMTDLPAWATMKLANRPGPSTAFWSSFEVLFVLFICQTILKFFSAHAQDLFLPPLSCDWFQTAAQQNRQHKQYDNLHLCRRLNCYSDDCSPKATPLCQTVSEFFIRISPKNVSLSSRFRYCHLRNKTLTITLLSYRNLNV